MLAAFGTADSGSVIEYRGGTEYSAPLTKSEAEEIVKAASASKLVAKETRDQHLPWASSGVVMLYKGTNMVGEIPFSADEFWIRNCLYRDDTGVFHGMQSKLRTARPTTNAPAR